jgi:hypothetical protein
VFDGNDMWPVTAESLADPADSTSAKVATADSYLTGNTWVALFKGVLVVELENNGFPLPLRIHDPIVTMQLSPNHQGATGGILAGVLSTEELVEDIKMFAASLDTSLCESPVIESIATQIAQASDIMADRTQDPTKTCDSISVGLGFSAARVTLGSVAPPPPPPPNPCTMP